jgi:hypothetical protein
MDTHKSRLFAGLMCLSGQGEQRYFGSCLIECLEAISS